MIGELKTLISSINTHNLSPTTMASSSPLPNNYPTTQSNPANEKNATNDQNPALAKNAHPFTSFFIDLASQTPIPNNNNYQMATRVTKIEFSRFDEEDLEGWLFKCELFFQFDFTPSNARVKLAAIHMEGKALQ
ncbi:conserved hypothetical protein [Ricinus communis]|uniref:Retrotransposon gag domain-containing protein n=1 Tax=Ricinus communis TaxID=3988 RepID=B9R6V2_RICCO|nr:conserved hypothetical protein [Ricinus communis]